MTRHRGARPGTAAATGLTHPGPWAERALCTQADPDAWFLRRASTPRPRPPPGSAGPGPVRGQCLDYALSGAGTWGGIATGIWGGTTPGNVTSFGSYERRWPRER
jgi:hypothetical protein